MGLTTIVKTFKSPDYKLLPFFHRSRDGWNPDRNGHRACHRRCGPGPR